MSTPVLIVGDSGEGKSHALRNLDPDTTFFINCVGKDLPFRGGRNHFKYKLRTDDHNKILSYINQIGKGEFRTSTGTKDVSFINKIVVDDFQYVMANEFLRRAQETGWGKFTEMGQHIWNIIKKSNILREDLHIYFNMHADLESDGVVEKKTAKTIGKLLKDKVVIEGYFSIVLFTYVEHDDQNSKFYYQTYSDGITTTKTPDGMFPQGLIPNDLSYVDKCIRAFYEGKSTPELPEKNPGN